MTRKATRPAVLKFLPSRELTRQKKRLWIFAFAAKLERTKILVPRRLGDIWLGFHPKPQLVEVFEANVAVAHTLHQVVANGDRKPGPGLDLHSDNLPSVNLPSVNLPSVNPGIIHRRRN